MAGVKGKSGGARINSGGARSGAGRKPKPPVLMDAPGSADPLQFLRDVMNDPRHDIRLRIDAAKSLMPYLHAKLGEVDKKDEQATAAKKSAGGKFAASAPPVRLVR